MRGWNDLGGGWEDWGSGWEDSGGGFVGRMRGLGWRHGSDFNGGECWRRRSPSMVEMAGEGVNRMRRGSQAVRLHPVEPVGEEHSVQTPRLTAQSFIPCFEELRRDLAPVRHDQDREAVVHGVKRRALQHRQAAQHQHLPRPVRVVSVPDRTRHPLVLSHQLLPARVRERAPRDRDPRLLQRIPRLLAQGLQRGGLRVQQEHLRRRRRARGLVHGAQEGSGLPPDVRVAVLDANGHAVQLFGLGLVLREPMAVGGKPGRE
eukprot:3743611-Rhodomonas_salina.2